MGGVNGKRRCCQAVKEPKRFAFIVCQNEYQGRFAKSNGKAVQETPYWQLKKLLEGEAFGFSPVYFERNAQKFEHLVDTIGNTVRGNDGALVLVWYAGHGARGKVYNPDGTPVDIKAFMKKLSGVHEPNGAGMEAKTVNYIIFWESCRTPTNDATSTNDAPVPFEDGTQQFSPHRPSFHTVYSVEEDRSAIGHTFVNVFIERLKSLPNRDHDLSSVLNDVAEAYARKFPLLALRAEINSVPNAGITFVRGCESPALVNSSPSAAPSTSASMSTGLLPLPSTSSSSHTSPPAEASLGRRCKIARISVAVVLVFLAALIWYLHSANSQHWQPSALTTAATTTTTSTASGCAPMTCGGRCGHCAEHFFCSSHGRCLAKYGCCEECGLFPAGGGRVKSIANVVANKTRCASCMDHTVAWLGDAECYQWHESLWPGHSVKITMSFSWYQALSHPNERRRILHLDADNDSWSARCGNYGMSWSEAMLQCLLSYAEHLGLQPAASSSSSA